MDDELQPDVQQTVGEVPPTESLGRTIHRRFAVLGGVVLELPEREPLSPPPDFG